MWQSLHDAIRDQAYNDGNDAEVLMRTSVVYHMHYRHHMLTLQATQLVSLV